MTRKIAQGLLTIGATAGMLASIAFAQSGATRPRRVNDIPATPAVEEQTPPPNEEAASSPVDPPAPAASVRTRRRTKTAPVASANTPRAKSATPTRAYSLLQQKQYREAVEAAKEVIASEPENAEAWKIAGFAEMSLKEYEKAATDLDRALTLQRGEGQEDSNTVDALAEALVRTEKFESALPLLVAATSRDGAPTDSALLYYRGLAEYRTKKTDDATRTLEQVVKANPKNVSALFYLGRIAYERDDFDTAIKTLNRAITFDPRSAESRTLLTYAYLRRAAIKAAAEGDGKTTKSKVPRVSADYLSAIRSAQTLYRIKPSSTSATLYGQALIGAKQYTRATIFLGQATAKLDEPEGTLSYLLGIAYSRIKSFPKAITALEQAAVKTPEDANIYRELGYAYEISKKYAKALAAYQKGAELMPDDTDFKEAVERVQPVAVEKASGSS